MYAGIFMNYYCFQSKIVFKTNLRKKIVSGKYIQN
jgi:hypothetical protein